MAFGFARVSHGLRPEAAASEAEAEAPPAAPEHADDEPPFEFEHVHGETCSCNLRGE
jgi:hypothetical protein